MEKKKKVVVAYSGGLDTSYTVMYLSHELGYEVYAACANTAASVRSSWKPMKKTHISSAQQNM